MRDFITTYLGFIVQCIKPTNIEHVNVIRGGVQKRETKVVGFGIDAIKDAWLVHAVSRTPSKVTFVSETSHRTPCVVHKGSVGAAVAADVRLVGLRVDVANRSRKKPGVVNGCPLGAGSGSDGAAVRPAEDHAPVHAGHVAPAAASVLQAREPGASVGALLVSSAERNPAKPLAVTDAVVIIPARAVIRSN